MSENENDNADPAIAVDEEKQPLELDVKVENVGACQRHVTVTISRDDIDRYYTEKFDELLPKAEIPGFRIGRARELVENHFKKQVSDQVKGSLLMDSLSQVSDDQDFSAISEPDIDFETISIPDDGPLTYEFDIEVRPEFDMPEWRGLAVERPEHEFTDKDIENEIERLAARSGDMVPVEEKAELNDFVVVNITSRSDGNVVSQLSEETIQIRPELSFADTVLDKFDKLVVGAAAGESRNATVKVSQFALMEEFHGKDVELEFEILDVKRIDAGDHQTLAERLGLDSGEKLAASVRNMLESRLNYEQRQKVRQQITSLLTEAADWELPPDLVRRQARRELERAVIEMRSSGFSEDDIRTQENQLRQEAMKRTENLLKEHFILERIAEQENIEESDEDYELEIAQLAIQQNDSPRRVRARLERTGQMDALRNMIIERKVIDTITENAKFKASKYKLPGASKTVAIDFFVSGHPKEDIPEAKYADPEEKPLPTTVERD